MPLHLHELHFNLGGVLYRQGRYGEAAEHYRQSIHFSQGLESVGDRTLADAHHNLGIALSHQGQWENAIACYQAALTLQPNDGTIYISLGIALSQCQRLDKAIAAYRNAVLRYPDFCLTHYYLGKAWQIMGNHTAAVECFQQSHRLDSAQPLVLNDLLVSLAELGRWDDMTQPLQTIATLPETRRVLDAYQHWVDPECGQDEVTQARWHCAKFLHMLQQGKDWKAPLAQMLWHWGNVLMSYGRESTLAQAETFYQQAIALQPQDVEYYASLVQCLVHQKRRAAAVVAARWGLTLNPGHPALLAELSDWFIEQKLRRSVESCLAETCSTTSKLRDTSACEGLNCGSCLRQIYQAFEPTHLGRGVFRVGAAPSLEGVVFSNETHPPSVFVKGRAWIAPQQRAWQACHSIAVFDQTGAIQPELCRDYPGQLPVCQQPYAPVEPTGLPPVHRLTGSAALLSGLSGHVYFHWMVDILPRIEALRSLHAGQIDWFIINSIQRPFQRETLQQLGIPLDQVVESDRYPHIEADRLVVPAFEAPLGWTTQRTVETLRRQFLSKKCHSLQYPKRIYITRSGARYRRVLNEASIIESLQTMGIVSVDLEQLSVAEQAQLFAHATLIVAPHGSGLTNLVFCQPGATVIELLSSNYVRHYYWPISQLCQLKHYTVVSPGLPCFSLRTWMYLNPLAEDIWVDEESLHKALQQALNAEQATVSLTRGRLVSNAVSTLSA